MTCCLMGGGVFWKCNLAQAVRFVIRFVAQPLRSPSPAFAGACLSRFAGEVLFTSGPACQGRETIPPRGADPKHPCNMLFRRTVVPGQRGGQDRRDMVIPGWWEAPHSIARSGPSSARSSGSISGRARSASVKKASPARLAQRRNTPTCGNGRTARHKVIHAALRVIANRRSPLLNQGGGGGGGTSTLAPLPRPRHE